MFVTIVDQLLIPSRKNELTDKEKQKEEKEEQSQEQKQHQQQQLTMNVFGQVSEPITWNDLSSVLPTDYTILNIPDILNKKSVNPWSNMLEKKQDLNKILENISQLFR